MMMEGEAVEYHAYAALLYRDNAELMQLQLKLFIFYECHSNASYLSLSLAVSFACFVYRCLHSSCQSNGLAACQA